MGVATMFGPAACKQPTGSSTEDGGPSLPAFDTVFNIDISVTQLTKDQLISAYAGLDASYVAQLQSNYVKPRIFFSINPGSIEDNTIIYEGHGEITIYGDAIVTTDVLKAVLNNFKNDSDNQLIALGNRFNSAKEIVRLSKAEFKFQGLGRLSPG
jgi:hypothetical protein